MPAAFFGKAAQMKEKEFTHMTYNDRLRLDVLIRAKHKPKEIAEILHKHISTIYRELGRGRYMHTNSDLTEEERYQSRRSRPESAGKSESKGRRAKNRE